MKITEFITSNITEFPTIAEVLGIKATQQTTSKSASTDTRKTVAEFDFTNKTIKLMKTNPVYKQEIKFDSIADMYKKSWFVLHSPKVVAVTFTTNFYGSTILSMVRYAEMIHLIIDIVVPNGKFHSSREYSVWYTEQQTRQDEFNLSTENIQLMVQHCPELLRYAKHSNDELLEVLNSQIQSSGYDVSMYSITTQDGLNHGKVEDKLGRPTEWSRDYTKHYERYNRTLNDLLLMYISCKFYTQHDIKDSDSFGTSDIDTYTGEDISFIPISIDRYMDDVVVPRSACGLGLQNYMN